MTVYLQGEQLLFAIQGEDLPPSSETSSYAVWLTGPGGKARRSATSRSARTARWASRGRAEKDLEAFPKCTPRTRRRDVAGELGGPQAAAQGGALRQAARRPADRPAVPRQAADGAGSRAGARSTTSASTIPAATSAADASAVTWNAWANASSAICPGAPNAALSLPGVVAVDRGREGAEQAEPERAAELVARVVIAEAMPARSGGAAPTTTRSAASWPGRSRGG